MRRFYVVMPVVLLLAGCQLNTSAGSASTPTAPTQLAAPSAAGAAPVATAIPAASAPTAALASAPTAALPTAPAASVPTASAAALASPTPRARPTLAPTLPAPTATPSAAVQPTMAAKTITIDANTLTAQLRAVGERSAPGVLSNVAIDLDQNQAVLTFSTPLRPGMNGEVLFTPLVSDCRLGVAITSAKIGSRELGPPRKSLISSVIDQALAAALEQAGASGCIESATIAGGLLTMTIVDQG